MKIHESLAPFVQAAQDAGMTVQTPAERPWSREAGHVYVTQDDKPGIAMIQVPSFPTFEPPSIDVPVKPNRLYGSAVVQDYDGSPADAVRLLGELMERDTVTPRFVGPHAPVPVDRRVPEDAEEVSV